MTELVELHEGYVAGAIGRVAELHASYYAKHWQFGVFFEAKVATELSSFLSRYESNQDAFWTLSLNERIEGSISIDGTQASAEGAHLRWFIISDALRGRGLGQKLITEAISFCEEKSYKRIYLWTFAGLDAARKLYDQAGFKLVYEETGGQWGTKVTEQKFELKLI